MSVSIQRQSGSAFFIILIAIAMFAGLSYTLMKGSRTASLSLTAEQSQLAAQEIIAYGDTVAKGVQALRLRGCGINEITFEENGDTSRMKNGTPFTYTNSAAPTDYSCHVFKNQGGMVTPRLLQAGHIASALVSTATAMDSNSWAVTATRVAKVGNDSGAEGTDVVLLVGRVTADVCLKINTILGVQNNDDEPPVDTFDCDDTFFTGTFTSCANALGNIPALEGKTGFCSGNDNSGTKYSYYRVLIAR